MDAKAKKRLLSFSRLLSHARERLALDLGFRLWDNSLLPADWPADAPTIAIADENVVSAMLRAPNVETLANLWVAGRIDILNGSIFDLVARRPKVRTAEFRRSLDRRLALGTGLKFLFQPRGGPWPLEEIAGEKEGGNAKRNKENVAYHYDVSNEFYALFLDERMVYTCGYAQHWDASIDEMQLAKLDHICRKLRLKPGDRLLDIGCGWGALCIHAAQHYGVHAHGVSLSEEQVAYAQEKVKRLGLEDRVTIEIRDYRHVTGKYDKVSSVGMQEHLGSDQYEAYYTTVRRVLKKDGLYFHQAITRPAKRRKKLLGRQNPEFRLLTKYIFPGGELDNIGGTIQSLERHGFEVHDVEDLREHYQRTCRHWHDRLLAHYDEAVALVGAAKTRLWIAYLAACSIAFERNTVCLYQTVASVRHRGASGLPPTREDLYRR
ncbi:cyclopropane-fatty-acyl-phospholipid synthase family protein [Mesorhizobium sp. RP14(2022)]|uniref:Cyclopropane-fatty-acyl-phospholipid synthase family protein n=1 Tax=Mesorhizobium liriopis TaxID=2953882 RepID=A0ABT1CAN7_9HYPH|nr:cyclopropane-fatty-acyl-phospholipid synthase family protein [Mesorhizobium liriopis]MCO6051881.1 cyclopropane-fatty-acyl-phospholipid synthase family protein [Mesorhizobium liriopis]